jgi:hypothetical protein
MKRRTVTSLLEPIHIPRQKVVQADKPNANKHSRNKYCCVYTALKKTRH